MRFIHSGPHPAFDPGRGGKREAEEGLLSAAPLFYAGLPCFSRHDPARRSGAYISSYALKNEEEQAAAREDGKRPLGDKGRVVQRRRRRERSRHRTQCCRRPSGKRGGGKRGNFPVCPTLFFLTDGQREGEERGMGLVVGSWLVGWSVCRSVARWMGWAWCV